MNPGTKLISVQKTAKRLDVSENTVRRMITDPQSPLKGCWLRGSVVRVVEESIEEAIRRGMEDILRRA